MSDTGSDSCVDLVANVTLFVECRIDQRLKSVEVGVNNFWLIYAVRPLPYHCHTLIYKLLVDKLLTPLYSTRVLWYSLCR